MAQRRRWRRRRRSDGERRIKHDRSRFRLCGRSARSTFGQWICLDVFLCDGGGGSGGEGDKSNVVAGEEEDRECPAGWVGRGRKWSRAEEELRRTILSRSFPRTTGS